MNGARKGYVRPLDLRHGAVDMTHGSGGRAMAQLIEELFAKHLGNDFLGQRNDGAVMPIPPGRLVMSTDGHVVSPLFFPGGDIGCLSINGTINDVAVLGATPLYLAAGFILEEGLPLADLARIVESMARAAREAGVPCSVLVMDTAPETKVRAIERLGATIHRATYDECWQTVETHRSDRMRGHFVHPFDDDAFIAGNATAGLEIAGVERWADSSVVLRARFRTAPLEQWTVRREFLRRLKRAFDERGIEIPFPQLRLHTQAG